MKKYQTNLVQILLVFSFLIVSGFTNLARSYDAFEPFIKGCEVSAEDFSKTALYYANEVKRILKANPNSDIEKLNKTLRDKFEIAGDRLFATQKQVKQKWEESLEKENASASRRREVLSYFEAVNISVNLTLEIALNQVIKAINESDNISEQRFQRNIETECKRRVYSAGQNSK